MKQFLIFMLTPLLFQFSIPASVFSAEQDTSAQKFNAKVARIKAKQRALARKNGTEGEASGCGGVNVGNVKSENKNGNIDNIVVVQGDIINIANNRKKK